MPSLGDIDAGHLASAEIGECDILLTTDDLTVDDMTKSIEDRRKSQ